MAKSTTPKEWPAPRSLATEQSLSKAIGGLQVVELKYRDDLLWRTFNPHCLFYSAADQTEVHVYGDLTANPNDPRAKLGPRDLEVGRITAIKLNDAQFQRPREFDRFAAKFKAGIITCI